MSVSGEPVIVNGNARLLRRLIRNLLDNATRHGRPPVDISVTAVGATAKLLVHDHGPGIDASDTERVFEPFFRKDSNTGAEKGAGLGLALVRQIARLHGGDAHVESASTIAISLPKCGI